MTKTLIIPKKILFYQHTGVFRVCETNPIYDILPGGSKGPGWIFVSNELPIDDAIAKHAFYEKKFPNLVYTIVPIFKNHAN